MDSLFILIPIALVFVFIAVRIFMWAVKSGQFEDLDTEGRRILFEEKSTGKKPGAEKDAKKNLLSATQSSKHLPSSGQSDK